MKQLLPFLGALALCSASLHAAEPAEAPKPPALKITPGQVIVPFDAMRRIWGELLSLDLKTRSGTFRKEGTDEVMRFTVLPYAELLHHATFGDLQDFRIGERAIFRMHENATGEWTWLTYIQDEMNMMNGHKEYFHVDSIDKDQLTCTQANTDKSYVREEGIVIGTAADTRYWKNAQPAKFSDIKAGDQIRTQTHGIGAGKTRVAWEVFLDDASLVAFQSAQKAVHAKRMSEEGAPGYVDKVADREISLTLFWEGGDVARALKAGQKVRVAPAGTDRKPLGAPVSGIISATKMAGQLSKTTVLLDAPAQGFEPAQVARLWVQ